MEDIVFCKGGGCTAKLGADVLKHILSKIPKGEKDISLLVGYDSSDDAAVYRISDDMAIVQTLDFFPPMVDDPYIFGQIAAAGGEGVSHGVELVITKDGGLKSARLDGKDIDPNAKYRVATLDYVAQGNDNMAAFKAAIDVKSPQNKDNNVRFIIMKYMKEKMSQGISVSSRIEGRIKTEEK